VCAGSWCWVCRGLGLVARSVGRVGCVRSRVVVGGSNPPGYEGIRRHVVKLK
ncbi:hypothetical protein KI387_007581, partial [Taxus chinensis]